MASKLLERNLPLLVIVGPTASGKTALAIEIAQRVNGEIICADSRTVFRHMDIGTAKPTLDEQRRAVHWGLDLVDPDERYTVAQFQTYARAKIADIRSRNKVPILVGGTGLYIDAVIFRYTFPARVASDWRRQLETMSRDELYNYCVHNNIILPENSKNKRHLVHAIMHKDHLYERMTSVDEHTRVFGIAVDKTTLKSRIHARTQSMVRGGVVEEARMLGDQYGWGVESMTGVVYPLLRKYLDQQCTLDRVVQEFERRDRQLAKRQMTWFRRNPEIAWGTSEDILQRISGVFTGE